MEKKSPEQEPLMVVAGVKLSWTNRTLSKLKEGEHKEPKYFWKRKKDGEINGAILVLRETVEHWSVHPSPNRHVSQKSGKPSHPIMATKLNEKSGWNYFHDPDFLYSEGHLGKQPRNRGATEENIYQLLQSQAWWPSTQRWRSSTSSKRLIPFYYSRLLSHQTMTHPYPLWESGETTHQTNPSSCTSVLREFWKWNPHGVAQHHAPNW